MVGINSFFVYNLPSWIILTIMGILSTFFIEGKSPDFSKPVGLALMGCNAAAAGVMVRSFLSYTGHFYGKNHKIFLIFVIAIVFYNFQSPTSLIFCLALGGIVSLYFEADDTRKKMSLKSENLFSRLEFNFILGKFSLYLMLFILAFLWIYFSIYVDDKYSYIFGFYLVGCLIIGPIESIFAFFLAVLTPFGHLDPIQIWIGVSLSFLLPGSHLNLGIYFGAMLDGPRGALLAALFVNLPPFLSLFGILPQWKHYRDRQGIRRLYEGLICSTTGLILAMIFLIMNHCMQYDISSPLCIFFISIFLNYFIGRYSFVIILLGGFFGYVRHFALNCYRYGTYCPFPFNF